MVAGGWPTTASANMRLDMDVDTCRLKADHDDDDDDDDDDDNGACGHDDDDDDDEGHGGTKGRWARLSVSDGAGTVVHTQDNVKLSNHDCRGHFTLEFDSALLMTFLDQELFVSVQVCKKDNDVNLNPVIHSITVKNVATSTEQTLSGPFGSNTQVTIDGASATFNTSGNKPLCPGDEKHGLEIVSVNATDLEAKHGACDGSFPPARKACTHAMAADQCVIPVIRDAPINSLIPDVFQQVTADLQDLTDALNQEITDRIAGDGVLSDRIDTLEAFSASCPAGSALVSIDLGAGTAVCSANFQSLIDGLDTRLSTAEGNIATLQTNVTDLQGRMTTAEGDITSLGGRMTTAEGNIVTLDGRLTTAEADITSLGARLTTAEGDIVNLTARVATAEGAITALEARVDSNETDIGNLTGRITTAEGDIVALSGRVTSVENDLANLQVRVAGAETNIANLQLRMAVGEANIANLQTRTTTAEGKIVNLLARMLTAENDISGLKGRVTAAETDITGLQSRVSAAEGNIVTLQTFRSNVVSSGCAPGQAVTGFDSAGNPQCGASGATTFVTTSRVGSSGTCDPANGSCARSCSRSCSCSHGFFGSCSCQPPACNPPNCAISNSCSVSTKLSCTSFGEQLTWVQSGTWDGSNGAKASCSVTTSCTAVTPTCTPPRCSCSGFWPGSCSCASSCTRSASCTTPAGTCGTSQRVMCGKIQ